MTSNTSKTKISFFWGPAVNEGIFDDSLHLFNLLFHYQVFLIKEHNLFLKPVCFFFPVLHLFKDILSDPSKQRSFNHYRSLCWTEQPLNTINDAHINHSSCLFGAWECYFSVLLSTSNMAYSQHWLFTELQELLSQLEVKLCVFSCPGHLLWAGMIY